MHISRGVIVVALASGAQGIFPGGEKAPEVEDQSHKLREILNLPKSTAMDIVMALKVAGRTQIPSPGYNQRGPPIPQAMLKLQLGIILMVSVSLGFGQTRESIHTGPNLQMWTTSLALLSIGLGESHTTMLTNLPRQLLDDQAAIRV